jgi:hypothetical protein
LKDKVIKRRTKCNKAADSNILDFASCINLLKVISNVHSILYSGLIHSVIKIKALKASMSASSKSNHISRVKRFPEKPNVKKIQQGMHKKAKSAL